MTMEFMFEHVIFFLFNNKIRLTMFSGGSGDIKMTSANRKCSAVTGSARKIKDNVADWHNLMLRWEKLNENGFCVAANIVNIKL